MMGLVDQVDAEGKDLKGIIPKSVNHIYGFLDNEANTGKNFLVRCAYLEIYNEQILDLLSKFGTNDKSKKTNHPGQRTESLKIKEDPDRGIYVQDLTQVICKSVPDLQRLLDAGCKNRKTGETAMNKDSSRSHSIFTIYIETSETGPTGETTFKVGKMNLVDLAGSERQSKTHATGERLKEANQINLSLSALGNVISALVDGKSKHIPYRTSKLTRLLQDSLGGNTKTVMIAALSPADYNFDETLSTLRYASRAKNIQNKPTVNEDPKDALLKQYEDEITQLRRLLAQYQNGEVASGPGSNAAAIAEQLNASFKKQMKDNKIQNDAEGVVQSLVAAEQPQDMLLSPRYNATQMSNVANQSAGVASPTNSMGQQVQQMNPQMTPSPTNMSAAQAAQAATMVGSPRGSDSPQMQSPVANTQVVQQQN